MPRISRSHRVATEAMRGSSGSPEARRVMAATAAQPTRTLLAAAIAAFALVTGPAAAQPMLTGSLGRGYLLDPDHSILVISSELAGGIAIPDIRFTRLDGDLTYSPDAEDRLSARIAVDMASAAAPGWTRRAALAALRPARWPRATFVSDRIQLVREGGWIMTGRLTLRGVSRPVRIDVALAQPSGEPAVTAHRLRFAGRGRIRRSDFGISAPPFTRDEMALRFDVEFVRARTE